MEPYSLQLQKNPNSGRVQRIKHSNLESKQEFYIERHLAQKKAQFSSHSLYDIGSAVSSASSPKFLFPSYCIEQLLNNSHLV